MKHALPAIWILLCAWQPVAHAQGAGGLIAAGSDGYLVAFGQGGFSDSGSIAAVRLDQTGAQMGTPFVLTTSDSRPISITGAGSAGWIVQTPTRMVRVDSSDAVTDVSPTFVNEDLGSHVFVGDGWIVARGAILVHQRLDGSTESAHGLAVNTARVVDIALGATTDGHNLVAWTDGQSLFTEQLDATGAPTTAPSQSTLGVLGDEALGGGLSERPHLRVTGTSEGWLVYTTRSGITSLDFVAIDGTTTSMPLPSGDGSDTRFAVPSATGATWVDLVGETSGEGNIVATALGPDGTLLGSVAPQMSSGFSDSFTVGFSVASVGSGFVLITGYDQPELDVFDSTNVLVATHTITSTTPVATPAHDGCSVSGDPVSQLSSMLLVLVASWLATRRSRACAQRYSGSVPRPPPGAFFAT